MAKQVFMINILNWDKHNADRKKHYRYFMLENRFFEDSKISQLKQIDVLLYLKCLCIAGDLSSSCIEVHAGLMPRRWRVDDKLLENSCKTLQENQLLTYEKKPSLYNRIELNRIELNRTEEKDAEFSTPPPPQKKSIKKSSQLLEPANANELREVLGADLIAELKSLYKDDAFVEHEITAALIWCKAENKSRRSKKGWNSFVVGWLKRGWDWRQKSNAGNSRNLSTASNGTARTYQNQRTESENNFFKNGSDSLIGGEK